MSSFSKHLLTAAILSLAVVAFVTVRNWDTFALIYDNMTTMKEGSQLAQQIRHPKDLLAYIERHPEDVSLVAYDVGARAEGIFFQAEQARPLVNVPDLLLLAEYARRVEKGHLDPARRVSTTALDRYALPGAGADHHEQARMHWHEAGYVDADGTVALRHVVDAITRFNDGAAADWLITELGREQVGAVPEQFGLPHSEPPFPASGVHLSWNHHAMTTSVAERLSGYSSMKRSVYADQVYRLAYMLYDDADFRREERKRQRQRGTDLSIRHQRAFAQVTYPHGTATDYADLMRRVAQGAFHSDSVSSFLQRQIEWTAEHDTLQVETSSIGSKAGAVPGILSFAGYLRRAGEQPPRVVVLFMEEVPISVFYHLLQSGIDKGFLLQLLSSNAFFQRIRAQLQNTTTAAAVEYGSAGSQSSAGSQKGFLWCPEAVFLVAEGDPITDALPEQPAGGSQSL